ncbi:MAG: aminoacyl-tRNA hydrolase [Candidatus Doudnabacteria bacterium RIFCSPHIGHO2_12_FULL_48_11]|uniref:Peptidyl-tRNA hydrolase n=1 Tax=Candidatus Doudnabacteria bacterium RIFCSPHIGHO2_01_FULL_46_24 TaxID=1817825 RepID=A0A1F5NTP0_9BACT|nr:MAG: aminoacyl-tRNA hydrolase [Candidatus Doudnabacteria bacterium RIFCSPHIGHO2_01_FULL_46_24]OGE94018.1 MAG: aminoacyl-tRNA hydrolase [Candidatus Doudnabacteria bacterium RIFCSPHIGHO2_12_FULL_48_11]
MSYLIIGLGNPGKQYKNTRHNLGFRVLDLLADGENWQDKHDSKFIKLNDIILAKPQTFMNKSGEAVKEILKYYPAAEMIVIHDDLDLPFGSIKVQKNISSAGHNGVQSIIDELGTQNFVRVRLGIDMPEARGRIPGDVYVLQNFSGLEEEIIKQQLLPAAVKAIETIQTQDFETAQSRFNG